MGTKAVPAMLMPRNDRPSRVVSVNADVYPFDRTHDFYQAYYRSSLSEYLLSRSLDFREVGCRFAKPVRALRYIRDSYKINRLVPAALLRGTTEFLAQLLGAGYQNHEDHWGPVAGTYTFHADNSTQYRVCIDAMDSGELLRPELLASADIYFKTNYWPGLSYPQKVVPLPNLNPMALPRLAELKELRAAPKEYDLFGFFRVRGGKDGLQGIEHNIRLFENLAKLRCKKFLLAYLLAGDVSAQARRLEKAGVSWTAKPMPRATLWSLAARSRLNIVRLGMHQCVPWRMTDMLAMGGCAVLDYSPRTRWPSGLENGVHYLSLDIPFRGSNESPIPAAGELHDRVNSWLSNPKLINSIGEGSGRYFDQYLSPLNVGRYIVEMVEQQLGSRGFSVLPF